MKYLGFNLIKKIEDLQRIFRYLKKDEKIEIYIMFIFIKMLVCFKIIYKININFIKVLNFFRKREIF